MFSLIFDLVLFSAGLVVAWNFWSQPAWVKVQVDKATAFVQSKLS